MFKKEKINYVELVFARKRNLLTRRMREYLFLFNNDLLDQ